MDLMTEDKHHLTVISSSSADSSTHSNHTDHAPFTQRRTAQHRTHRSNVALDLVDLRVPQRVIEAAQADSETSAGREASATPLPRSPPTLPRSGGDVTARAGRRFRLPSTAARQVAKCMLILMRQV